MSEAKRAAYCRAATLPKQTAYSRGAIQEGQRTAEPQLCRNRPRTPEAQFGKDSVLQSRNSAETNRVLL
ncbi:hypothetical protein ACSAZL_11330 [Methanosarcina sp. T3]|uniref:hypothetical protein n=1 Tax=Methanosarcina sp. T3 TaxID=3439062 RepID=UPI003F871466